MTASAWVALDGYRAHERFRDHHTQQMSNATRSVGRQVDILLKKLKVSVELFADAYSHLLWELQSNPGDEDTFIALSEKAGQYFPGYHGIAVTNPIGELLFDDFGEKVGALCRSDLDSFVSTPLFYKPYIHPGPSKFHFDIMVPWSHQSTSKGVFFISFTPDQISQILQDNEASGYELILVREDKPGLIEINNMGGRDLLDGDHHLSVREQQAAIHGGVIPNTRWIIMASPDQDYLLNKRNDIITPRLMIIIFLLGLGFFLSHRIYKSESRRNFAEKISSKMREKYESIITNMQDGYCMIDIDGYIKDVNPAMIRMLGYDSREDLIGRHVEREVYASPKEHNAIRSEVLDKGYITGREIRLKKKDSKLIYGDMNANTVYVEDNQIIGIEGTFRDTTLRKQTEMELLESRNQAESANQAKSEFLSSMSHELRTPLNAVIGFSQLFEHDEDLNNDQKDKAKKIYQAGCHLLSLIDEVLDLVKIESGHIDLNMKSLSISKLLEECCTLILPLANKHNISLDIDPSQFADLYIYADYTRMKQVLLNLISNAVKYNRKNGNVDVDCEMGNQDHVRIKIIDTGQGISKDKIDQLFQPFNRLGEEFGDKEGTGIGLVITRQLIELMGGTMGVDSTKGKGSTFWVEFELLSSVTHDQGHSDTKSNADSANLSGALQTRARVLIAEDNIINQEVIRDQLSTLNLRADVASDGLQALQQLHDGEYDLMLADIQMPLMDGYELVGKIREAEQQTGAHLPIIAITANAMDEDAQRCLDAGFDDFVGKPVRLAELQSALVKWLPAC